MGFESVREALRLLWAHKGRASLTMFGLVWGTAAVILLVGWGEGLTRMLDEGFAKAGKNLAHVWSGRIGEDFTPAVDRRFLWFTIEDVEVLRKRARLPEIVGAQTGNHLSFAYRQRAMNVDTRGMDVGATLIRGIPLASGRNIRQSDVDHRRRVVVLGSRLRRQLLGADGGIGSWVRIDGKPFQVIGVLAHVGEQLNRDGALVDDQAWIPLTSMHVNWPRFWTDKLVVATVLLRLRDRDLLEETRSEVRAILAERLHVQPSDEEAIVFWSPLMMLNKLPLDQTRVVLFLIAATTLVIGGIGTLTMMLDSVHERRQEIGVRLAIGARRTDVIAQFFLETLTIVLLGGLLGVGLGVGGCLALAQVDVPELIPVPILRGGIIALALGIMGGVGVVAGVVPAWRASRVDPALTLRME